MSVRKSLSPIQQDIILPFIGIRILLIVAAYVARLFPPYFNFPHKEAMARGWHHSSYYLLDIWMRWDSGWYLTIVKGGYYLNGDPAEKMSNVAFYPLYPFLVKLIAGILPGGLASKNWVILVGVLLSNAFLVVGLILLYKMIRKIWEDRTLAKRTIWLLLVFPTAFVFSSFYTESLFFMLAVAAFWFGIKEKWLFACLCGLLLGMCRPVGLAIGLPLLWMYMESMNGKLFPLRASLLYFLLIPLGFVSFLLYIHETTGSFLHTFEAQGAWGKSFTWPWKTIIFPAKANIYHTPFEWLTLGLFSYGTYVAFRRFPSRSYGIFALLLILPPLFSGMLTSSMRYYLVIFPVFIALALVSKKEWQYRVLWGSFLLLQVIYFMGWCRFYWIA